MVKKCPCCDNTILLKASTNDTKQGLVKVEINFNPPRIHGDSVIPVDTYICKNCGFIMLFHPNVSELLQKANQD